MKKYMRKVLFACTMVISSGFQYSCNKDVNSEKKFEEKFEKHREINTDLKFSDSSIPIDLSKKNITANEVAVELTEIHTLMPYHESIGKVYKANFSIEGSAFVYEVYRQSATMNYLRIVSQYNSDFSNLFSIEIPYETTLVSAYWSEDKLNLVFKGDDGKYRAFQFETSYDHFGHEIESSEFVPEDYSINMGMKL